MGEGRSAAVRPQRRVALLRAPHRPLDERLRDQRRVLHELPRARELRRSRRWVLDGEAPDVAAADIPDPPPRLLRARPLRAAEALGDGFGSALLGRGRARRFGGVIRDLAGGLHQHRVCRRRPPVRVARARPRASLLAGRAASRLRIQRRRESRRDRALHRELVRAREPGRVVRDRARWSRAVHLGQAGACVRGLRGIARGARPRLLAEHRKRVVALLPKRVLMRRDREMLDLR